MGELFGALATGWPDDAATRRMRLATIGHALAYETWRSLTDNGLSDSEAVGLMIRLVTMAAEAPDVRRRIDR